MKYKELVFNSTRDWFRIDCFGGKSGLLIKVGKNIPFYSEDAFKIIVLSGETAYYWKGRLHNIGGPALISNSIEYFFINGVGYPRELEYWIAVEKYLKDHPEERKCR